MKIELTNEEKMAIELYKNGEYLIMNQLLVNDSNSDISLIREDVENKSVKINYDRETLIRDLKAIKVIYELMHKIRVKRNKQDEWAFIRGTNIAEVERFKTEKYIDKCLDASTNKEDAENKYASLWNEPAVLYIRGEKDIPYIDFDELEDISMPVYKNEILISPFTKIKSFINGDNINLNNKIAKTFNIFLEKQELQGMPKEEKQNLYINILGNSDFINLKINEIVRLEKESNNIYENIRKLEQLIAKYEQELEIKKNLENYSFYELNLDEENISRLKNEVDSLKKEVNAVYEKIKECTECVTKWKRNVTIYVMSECYDIDVEYKNKKNEEKIELENFEENLNIQAFGEGEKREEDNKEIENFEKVDFKINNEIVIEEKENLDNPKETEPFKTENSNVDATIVVPVVNSEKVEEVIEIDEKKASNIELVEKMKEVTTTCSENSETIEKLLENVKFLLTKQQNHAKLAGLIGAKYSALNNCFEMKKQAEILSDLNNKIKEKIENIYSFEKENVYEKLDKISEINFQVSTLLNYLNNPKSSVGRTKISRFEEMAIIEENEFKRCLAELLLNIRGEAELKKLRDDLEIIEDKNPLQKFFGIFTGRNRLDEVMIEQIEIREVAVRKTLAKKMRLDYNYSIHELIAETEMFIRENDDDDLVEKDVKRLKGIEEKLKQNFVIHEEKVKDIIIMREGRNLPIDDKITREELIEIETYRFLKKYGYDKVEKMGEQLDYQDTTAKEIGRIIEYVQTSEIL